MSCGVRGRNFLVTFRKRPARERWQPCSTRKGPTFWELAVQALSSTERGYDLLAPKFDYTPFRTPDAVLRRRGRAPGGRWALRSRARRLLRHGRRRMRMLRPLCRERVVGLDFSRGMLEVGAQAAGRRARRGAAGVRPRRRAGAAVRAGVRRRDLLRGLRAHPRRRTSRACRRDRPGAAAGRPLRLRDAAPCRRRGRRLLDGAAASTRRCACATGCASPPFIMYYLTFLLPRAREPAGANGFDVEIRAVHFARPWTDLRLVVATRRAE